MAYAPNITDTVDSRCGLHCTGCGWKKSSGCGGCIETAGHPFHGACRSRRAARTGALPTVANARNCPAGCSRTIPVTRSTAMIRQGCGSNSVKGGVGYVLDVCRCLLDHRTCPQAGEVLRNPLRRLRRGGRHPLVSRPGRASASRFTAGTPPSGTTRAWISRAPGTTAGISAFSVRTPTPPMRGSAPSGSVPPPSRSGGRGGLNPST